MKKIFLFLILLLGLAHATTLNSTTIGNYTFTFAKNNILGEKISLGVSNNNSNLLNGFSCNTYTQKDSSVIENNYESSIKSGIPQNQISVPLYISDKYQLYNYYNVSVLCIGNQDYENAVISYEIYIEPAPSFNLFLNIQLFLIQNGLMLVVGFIFTSIMMVFIASIWGIL